MRSRAQTSLAHSLSGPISCTLIPPHQSLPTYPIVLCYVSVLSHQSLAPSLSFLPVVRCPSPSPCPSPQFPSPDPQFPIFNSPVSIHSIRGRSGWAFAAVSVTVTCRLVSRLSLSLSLTLNLTLSSSCHYFVCPVPLSLSLSLPLSLCLYVPVSIPPHLIPSVQFSSVHALLVVSHSHFRQLSFFSFCSVSTPCFLFPVVCCVSVCLFL